MAQYHFTTTEAHAERVAALIGTHDGVYKVGSLSLDNLEDIVFYANAEFGSRYGVPLSEDTILVTLHPETVSLDGVSHHADVVAEALTSVNRPVLITMPNADPAGSIIRERFQELARTEPKRIHLVENLGTRGYFTALERCSLVLGNSSSGIIEAASFGKQVINLGDRQKGRPTGPNVSHVSFDGDLVRAAINRSLTSGKLERENIYYNGGATERIIEALKKIPAGNQ
jgi:GDP/UDP-N,N'-diacetylbacillosamine 2-epimerase (hydrolysing)